MARYVTQVRTPLKAEEAFAWMADFSNAAVWDPGVASATKVSEGPPKVGDRFDLELAVAGRTTSMTYEIIELDAPSRVVLRSETPLLISLDTITVLPVDDGAEVTYDADLRLKGVLGLADPALRLVFGRIGDKAAAGLRTHLHGEEVRS